MWPGTFAMKAIESNRNLSDFLNDYKYQPELTGRLDRLDSQPFTQVVVNEIVLWKVNRYALLSPATLKLLNSLVGLQPGSHRAARDVILALLGERGVDLPMASTLLRFRNPSTFQIIDRPLTGRYTAMICASSDRSYARLNSTSVQERRVPHTGPRLI